MIATFPINLIVSGYNIIPYFQNKKIYLNASSKLKLLVSFQTELF